MQVYHKHFGKGTVLNIMQINNNLAYRVQFGILKTPRIIKAIFCEVIL